MPSVMVITRRAHLLILLALSWVVAWHFLILLSFVKIGPVLSAWHTSAKGGKRNNFLSTVFTPWLFGLFALRNVTLPDTSEMPFFFEKNDPQEMRTPPSLSVTRTAYCHLLSPFGILDIMTYKRGNCVDMRPTSAALSHRLWKGEFQHL